MTTEIITTQEETSLVRLDAQALIATAIEKGSGIETLERLVALAKEVRAEQAREAWYAAMSSFQARCPAIHKTRTAKVFTKGGGGYEYRFAPLDEITGTIVPVMGECGLSMSWRVRIEATQVSVACRLAHLMGHAEESGEVVIPIEKYEGTGANPAQRVGIAMAYAKRYALLGIIGMAPEDDTDAKGHHEAESGPVSAARPEPAAADSGGGERLISEPQAKRLYAIARGAGWSDEQIHELLSSYQYDSSKQIRIKDYEPIVERLKGGPPKK